MCRGCDTGAAVVCKACVQGVVCVRTLLASIALLWLALLPGCCDAQPAGLLSCHTSPPTHLPRTAACFSAGSTPCPPTHRWPFCDCRRLHPQPLALPLEAPAGGLLLHPHPLRHVSGGAVLAGPLVFNNMSSTTVSWPHQIAAGPASSTTTSSSMMRCASASWSWWRCATRRSWLSTR